MHPKKINNLNVANEEIEAVGLSFAWITEKYGQLQEDMLDKVFRGDLRRSIDWEMQATLK